MRKKIVAGNWKMNMTPDEAVKLISELWPLIKGHEAEVIYCVPFVDISSAQSELKGSDVKLGAQNMFYEDKGAFTGEISAPMLKSLGVSHVILGHSERRMLFSETDELINKKMHSAISHGLTPILCCGETLRQREAGVTMEHITGQIGADLKGIDKEAAADIIIAYEPVWAIGTGRTATSSEAEEVCAGIRQYLSVLYDQKTAEGIRILYGGSVNAGNAGELFGMPDIDGGLIGGASLKAEFADIVRAAE